MKVDCGMGLGGWGVGVGSGDEAGGWHWHRSGSLQTEGSVRDVLLRTTVDHHTLQFAAL